MFLASALAASPAGLYLSPSERQTIAEEASTKTHPKQYAARAAAQKCMVVLQNTQDPRETLMRMWNDGTTRAIDFPLLDEDLPNDISRVKDPQHFFKIHGKAV